MSEQLIPESAAELRDNLRNKIARLEGERDRFEAVGRDAMTQLILTTERLARVTAERDRLIEAWPHGDPDLGNALEHYGGDRPWLAHSPRVRGVQSHQGFTDRTEAVRFAAGLDPEPED